MPTSSNALVFLHGFLGSKDDWYPVMDHLKEFTCVALELPGHGTDQEISLALRSYQGATLIGYSMGGRMALAHAEQTARTIALSAHPGLLDEKEKARRLHQDLQWAQMLRTLQLQEFLDYWYGQPLFDSLTKRTELFAQILERRLNNDPKTLADMLLKHSLAHQSLLPVTSKTFFVCGEEDKKYHELYRKLIPREQVRVAPGCGHALHLENPELCAKIIREIIHVAN